jgi:acetyl-CoA carboxylase carboxyl transferase subunit alpha
MRANVLDFERPVTELEEQIAEIKRRTAEEGIDRSQEIANLEAHVQRLMDQIYSHLSPWDRVLIARHPDRPYTLDYIRLIFDEFQELHGDRLFGDDPAIVGGIARFGDRWVTVIGHQKGRDIHERSFRNFGSARPEGYRKALRLMKLAELCRRPILCFVDTPAADPTVPSEERGISEAIARNIREMFMLRVPIIVVLTGEGGSGGALGLGVGDRMLMMEHAVYSVIPPEGCAAILWRDPAAKAAERAPRAAGALRLTAEDALHFGVVDEVIPEPRGGAHRSYEGAASAVRLALLRHLSEIEGLGEEERLNARYERFRRIGEFAEIEEGDLAGV